MLFIYGVGPTTVEQGEPSSKNKRSAKPPPQGVLRIKSEDQKPVKGVHVKFDPTDKKSDPSGSNYYDGTMRVDVKAGVDPNNITHDSLKNASVFFNEIPLLDEPPMGIYSTYHVEPTGPVSHVSHADEDTLSLVVPVRVTEKIRSTDSSKVTLETGDPNKRYSFHDDLHNTLRDAIPPQPKLKQEEQQIQPPPALAQAQPANLQQELGQDKTLGETLLKDYDTTEKLLDFILPTGPGSNVPELVLLDGKELSQEEFFLITEATRKRLESPGMADYMASELRGISVAKLDEEIGMDTLPLFLYKQTVDILASFEENPEAARERMVNEDLASSPETRDAVLKSAGTALGLAKKKGERFRKIKMVKDLNNYIFQNKKYFETARYLAAATIVMEILLEVADSFSANSRFAAGKKQDDAKKVQDSEIQEMRKKQEAFDNMALKSPEFAEVVVLHEKLVKGAEKGGELA
ncbi:MAG: hypothetical protein ABIF01_02475 [Candidatus Micrarchaeota archaeon]